MGGNACILAEARTLVGRAASELAWFSGLCRGSSLAADLGTITRSDGSNQVTYKGHPLYYYLGDYGPGSTAGQGNDGFGAKWWVVAPSESPITVGSSTGATSSDGSSRGGG